VNRYCLLNSVDAAFELAEKVEADGCEPGPFYLVEALREEASLK
jgi:hypothetical protein